MKTLLLFCLMIAFILTGFSQERPVASKALRDISMKRKSGIFTQQEFVKTPGAPAVKGSLLVEEEQIGQTRYDLQTNTSIQNRIHVYEDGAIGATWTIGLADPGYADRGTGYNYYDGTAWGAEPTERIETVRTGWPSYAPYGETGEMVVSHDFTAGSLILLTRDDKGTGSWTESEFVGPGTEISWNRSTTSGINNSVIQMLYITWPTPNGGTVYEGLDGAILYSRSTDGGASWDPQHALLNGMTSGEYAGFSADDYEWAATDDDNIAFLVGDSWFDFFLMKSGDGGDTWEKTVIWHNPYPFFNISAPTVTDTFYCVDGAHHLTFDQQGKVHVVFGINRAYSDGSGTFWFPFVDGVGYWNEDMPAFTDNLNALNPYGHPDSELIEDENLIGWSQDVDGDGELTFLDEIGTYFISLSSQPQIVIDDMNNKFVVFSSVTETYDNGVQNYRHLWARASGPGSNWGEFAHLTSGLIHLFDECVFPSVAPYCDDNFYLIYQADSEPGLSIRGDLDPPTDNFIYFMEISKMEVPVGTDNHFELISNFEVSQNFPNPVSGKTHVTVDVSEKCSLSLDVLDVTGKIVSSLPYREVNKGTYTLLIDASGFTPGVYFYRVDAGDRTMTRKMMVE